MGDRLDHHYDGNGRTARLLATFLPHRGDYGLNGCFSLEEAHAQDLEAYYRALITHPHHNYYEGRNASDITPWLDYFIAALTRIFHIAQDEAVRAASEGIFSPSPEALRRLNRRARIVFALFTRTDQITAHDVAHALGLSPRTARLLLNGWTQDVWLIVANRSNRARAYALSAEYRQHIDRLSAMPDMPVP